MKFKTLNPVNLIFVILITSFSIMAQETKNNRISKPIKAEKLSQKILPIPRNFSVNSTKYFNMIVESLSEVTVNLYDENKELQSKIILKGNPIKKTVEYEISGPALNTERVKITYTSESGKEIANAASSSGKKLKIIVSKSEPKGECKTNTLISDIEIIDANGFSRKISDLKAKIEKGELQTVLEQIEEIFFDSVQLKTLRDVLFSLNELQGVVAQNSLTEEPMPEEPVGIPTYIV